MTQLSPEQQDQVVNSFGVAQNKPVGGQQSAKWHQKHSGKIKIGSFLAVIAVMTYVFSGLLLNLRVINADSVVLGANSGDMIGTIYTNEDQTTPIAANKTVALSINGAAKTTVETNASGQFTFTGSPLNAGDVVAIFLDDETEKASFVFLAQGLPYMDGVFLVTNNVKVGHFNAGPITNANLDIADNVTDDDLKLSVSAGVATFADDMKLWVRSEKTYTPGGNVVCDDIRILGTAAFGAYSLKVSGSFMNTGTMTINSASSVTFDSTSSETINAGTSNLGYVNFDGVGGQWTLSGTFTTEYLHLRHGTVTGTADVTVRSGDATSTTGENGVINMTDGTFTVYSNGIMDNYTTWTFNNLTLGNGMDGAETDKQTSYQLNINGVLTIASTHTYHTLYGSIYLAGNGSPFVLTGTFNPGASTFILAGTDTQNVPSTTFNNLTIQNSSEGGVVFAGSLTVNGVFVDTTASSKVTFNSGSTYNFNSISINGGAKTTKVVLTSSIAGSAWNLNITASNPTASYVDVKDSNANKDITALTGGKDSTGNTHWLFPAYDLISGTVYSDNNKSSNIGANKTIALSLNGEAVESVETDANGYYAFTEVQIPENAVVAMFINDETEKGSIIIRTGVVDTTYTGLEWYVGNVKPTFRVDTDITEITNAQIDVADNVGDADIGFSHSGGAVTYNDGMILYVWTNKVYRPEGSIVADDVEIDGTLSMEGHSLVVSGDFTDAGLFTTTGGVLFDSTSAGKVITSGGDNLGVVTFDGSGGEWTLQDDLTTAHLAILNGKLIDNAKNVNVGGNIMISTAENSLVSTGIWTMTASGDIANGGFYGTYPPDQEASYNGIYNTIYDFRLAEGVTARRTGHLNIRNLAMGNLSAITSSGDWKALRIWHPWKDDFISYTGSYSVTGNSSLGSGTAIYVARNETRTQKAISWNENLIVGHTNSGLLKMTGDWTVSGGLLVSGDYFASDEATANTLDTNGKNLNLSGNLQVGYSHASSVNKYQSKIKFSSGTHRIGGSLLTPSMNTVAPTGHPEQVGGYPHGYYDFGSATIYLGGSFQMNYASVVGSNTGTIILNGSAAQNIINTSGMRLNNLKFENSSEAGVIFNDGVYVDGSFTNITPSSKMTFKSGAIFNFNSININGGSANTKISMLPSVTGSRWYFTIPTGTPTVSYVTVKDSSAVAGNTINARTSCTDNGGNINWDFGVVAPTATPTPSPSAQPSAEVSVASSAEPSATVTAIRSKTATPIISPTITSTISALMSSTAVIYPSITATISDFGNELLTDPEVTSGEAIVLVANGKAVKVGENDEVKLFDTTPEFKGVTEPNAVVDASITGRVSVSERTTADEVGTWFVNVKDKLPTGKYLLNLTFKEDDKILGSRSYRFEIARNYLMDAVYITILLAILAALIILIKKTKIKKSEKS